jgi:diguanylate cyclase (GGDEF)-like protein
MTAHLRSTSAAHAGQRAGETATTPGAASADPSRDEGADAAHAAAAAPSAADAAAHPDAGARPRLADFDSIRTLMIDVEPLAPETLGEDVHERFVANSKLHAIPIVRADGVPVGLVNRYRFLEAISRRFGRDLLGRRPATQFMEPSPLIVDEHLSLGDLSHIIVEDSARYIYDGFIVTREGRYAGMGTGYSLIRALTERKQAHLYHLAHHDVLTGLANRYHFDECLLHALASAELSTTQVGLLFVDLDRFKSVNDTFGHSVGDLLLKAVADRLKTCVRGGDTVTRLSGDEFAVILPGISAVEPALAIARTMVDTIAEPFFLEGYELRLSCSLGVALYPQHGLTPQKLLNCADAAAYHAKQIRNTFQMFTPDMNETAAPAICTYSTLRKAIETEQLAVHYQPKIDLRSNRICGFEALVRWPHPTEGMIAAGDIVHVAEETGLMVPLTEWVLRTACLQTLAWRQSIPGELRMAINVSGVQFKQNTLVGLVRRVLDATGLPTACLEIELTESVVMHHAPSALATLRALKAMDIRVAIDDFGTGYSSLSYLQRLPVEALKIDRSFIHHIDRSRKGSALAKAIITMAHSLDLRVMAEGVETEGQLAFLRKHECDEVQGYIFSAPLSADDATQYLRDAMDGDFGPMLALPLFTNPLGNDRVT